MASDMGKQLYIVDPDNPSRGPGQRVPVEAVTAVLRDRTAPDAIMFLPRTEGAGRILRELSRLVPDLLSRKLKERQERRIEGLLENMLDFDPLDSAETRIDVMNAEMRRTFLSEHEVLDAAAVHDRAGHEGSNKAQTAATWRKAQRILGLPFAGKMIYPAFQFDADGQPWPLLQKTLKALPPDRSAWQRAFWLVAPNEWLDGGCPVDAIRVGDKSVVEAARRSGEDVVG